MKKITLSSGLKKYLQKQSEIDKKNEDILNKKRKDVSVLIDELILKGK